MKTKDNVPQNQLKIETMRKEHLDIIENFDTSNKELKDFLVEDAFENQKRGISKTYIWFHKPTNNFVAYVTILADAIRVHGTKLGISFEDKGITYKTMPALKIGRLCVSDKYRNRKIGSYILIFVMNILLEINEKIGCRFLVVDAKKESIHFYRKKSFLVLKERLKGTIPMYFDMMKEIEYFRKEK